MGADWFKLIADVAEVLGAGDEAKRGPLAAYHNGRATQTSDQNVDGVYVYERRLTRPRDPSINDR